MTAPLHAYPVAGTAMEPEIKAGETLIVDTARTPAGGEVVVVRHQGQTLIRRWWGVRARSRQATAMPATKRARPSALNHSGCQSVVAPSA